ncbi:MAG: class I SAM-dependent methyltransferase, partial [Rhodoferax sp.]|nr:class I SAM-dependent methyltransferase [Rhodoferax sp.]
VLYCRCTNCGFCFSPKIARWSLAEFAQRIYNKDYVHIDPDYLQTRPLANAEALIAMFMGRDFSFNHLDYGGGSGLLSQTLSNSGWVSKSYDPFVDRELNVDQLGIFDLVTAYEVFEHVPDPRALMENLSRLTKTDGIILFSTLISDGEIEPYGTLSWWYAAPRNGHISLFSLRSLTLLAAEYGFHFGSFTNGYHVMWRTVPSWASRIFNNLPAKTGN